MVDYSCTIKFAMPVSVISAMREASGQGFAVKGDILKALPMPVQ